MRLHSLRLVERSDRWGKVGNATDTKKLARKIPAANVNKKGKNRFNIPLYNIKFTSLKTTVLLTAIIGKWIQFPAVTAAGTSQKVR